MIADSVTPQLLMGRVINAIPIGMLVASCVWLVLRFAGKHNPRAKFTVWFLALLFIACLPFVPLAQTGTSVSPANANFTLPAWCASGLLALWAFAVFFALTRIVVGIAKLSLLRHDSIPVPTESLDGVLRRTIEECESKFPGAVRITSRVRVPTAVGFFSPAILLPEWTLKDLPPEDLASIILHEFAHLQRRDAWTNLVQKLVRAIFFFHPAVLWIESRLSLEREMACDEVVVAKTGNAYAYATCLVALAERTLARRSIALAQAAIGRVHDISIRLSQILSLDHSRRQSGKPIFIAAGTMLMLTLVAMPEAPRFIAFTSSAPTATLAEIQPPKIPQAMIVPAVARENFSQKPTVTHPVTRQTHASARHEQPTRPHQPRVVLAKAPSDSEQVFVFVQRTNYYQQGSGILAVTEWGIVQLKLPLARSAKPETPNRT
jgi:beta-lactamase regulating signal transducer with metallopeptidase domain